MIHAYATMKVRSLACRQYAPPPQTTAPGAQADHDPALPVIIETLRHDGIITARQLEAARFWATDYRIGVMGLEDPLFDRTSLGLSRRPLNGRSGSINRYRHIHDIIGARYERVLIAAMIDHRPCMNSPAMPATTRSIWGRCSRCCLIS